MKDTNLQLEQESFQENKISNKFLIEIRRMHSVNGFFRGINKELNQFVTNSQKILTSFISSFNETAGWSKSIREVICSYKDIFERLKKNNDEINKEILTRLERFTIEYETKAKGILAKSSKVAAYVKAQMNKLNDNYTKIYSKCSGVLD